MKLFIKSQFIIFLFFFIFLIIGILEWQEVFKVRKEYKIISEERISIENDSYLLALWEKIPNESFGISENIFKIYALDNNQIFNLFEKNERFISYEIKDIDKNGTPEIVLELSTGGNCWQCTWIEILKIKNKKVEKVRIDYPERWMEKWIIPERLIDLDNDGIEEIIALDTRWEFYKDVCHACSPAVDVIFSLKDGVYRISSRKFPNFYEDKIKSLEKILEENLHQKYSTSNEAYYFGNLISLLLNYIFKGEKEKGLLEFQKYADKYNFESKTLKEEIENIKTNLNRWISENYIDKLIK